MTTDLQKQKELVFARQLASALSFDWELSFPPNELEWPDLLVNDGASQFGLEVREFTKDQESRKGSQLRASENKNKSRISDLAQKYYEQSEVPIKVNILGGIENEEEILSYLTEFSKSSDVWENKRIELDRFCTIYITRFPDEIGKYYRWAYVDDRVGWVKEINIEDILPLISDKERKLNKYRTHVKDVRLMLVADPTFSSGMVSFDKAALKESSEFNEVYLFIYPKDAYRLHS